MNVVRKLLCLLALACLPVLAVGCNGWEDSAYKTLKSLAVAYDASMEAAASHYETIKNQDDKAAFRDNVLRYAEPAHAALVTAKEALKAYSKAAQAYEDAKSASTPADESTLTKLLDEASAAKAAAQAALDSVRPKLDELKEAINTIIGVFTKEG